MRKTTMIYIGLIIIGLLMLILTPVKILGAVLMAAGIMGLLVEVIFKEEVKVESTIEKIDIKDVPTLVKEPNKITESVEEVVKTPTKNKRRYSNKKK